MAAGDKFRSELHHAEQQARRSRYEDDGAQKDFELSDARITGQIGFIEDQLSKTNAIFSELLDRITPILFPARPGPTGPDMPGPKETSELSARLDGVAQQVMNLQARIATTQDRVQL